MNNVISYADSLSRLDIDSLMIQEEEEEEEEEEEVVLTILSGSERNSIRNIKLTILMHTAFILKEQAKVKNVGLR
jgi:hypothetical protein